MRRHVLASMTMAALALSALGGCGDSGTTTPPGDGSVEDATSGDGGTCSGGDQMCGSRCVNTQTDPMNCGECGNTCSAGAFCEMGECTRTCSAGLMSCGGSCVDLATDPDHCGECDNPCADDRVCMGGSCVCADELTQCGEECVDPYTDMDHCGMCGRMCQNDESCQTGRCTKLRESDCLDEMDNDGDDLIDCEDVEDCEGTERDCDCAETADTGTEICSSSGTWGECMGCEPPPECTFDRDCDYGYECGREDTCQLDDSARWDIVVVDAEINSRTVSDGCWDSCVGFCCGDPDPFAKVQVESSSSTDVGQSMPEDDTRFPEWNQNILLGVEAWKIRDYLAFELRDSEPAGSQRIGRCFFSDLSEYYFGGDIRTMDCPRDPDFDNAGFRVRFRIQEP